MTTSRKPPLFGVLALQSGHIDEEQLEELMREPLDTTTDDGSTTLCTLCLKRKMITPAQAQHVLMLQNYKELRDEDEALGG